MANEAKKNWIDAKGNYHNVENLTLTQIYNRGFSDGTSQGKEPSEWLTVNLIGGLEKVRLNVKCAKCGEVFCCRMKYCGNCGSKMKV